MQNKKSEIDLASECMLYLKSEFGDQIEIYQEVSTKNRVVDIVYKLKNYFAEGNDLIVAIECKLNFNLELLSQAFDNNSFFHKSFICVPKKKESNGKSFAEMVCKNHSIGIMEVHDDFGVIVKFDPKSINLDCKLPKLYEEQKNWKSAGGNSGKIFTEFANTIKNIFIHLDSNNIESIGVNELITKINHHYKNNRVASSVIVKLVKNKVIKGLSYDRLRSIITRNEHFESDLLKYKK